MRTQIRYGSPRVSLSDKLAVLRALGNSTLTQGPTVQRFEEALAATAGASNCLAFNSATSALQAAYSALGVIQGTRVWTTAVSFVATANAARSLGAEVTFLDIDPKTFNLNIRKLEEALETAYGNQTLPQILAAVDLGGLPENAEELARLKAKYGFRVLRDASHSLGARDSFGPVGAGVFADVTVFSFHALKNITTGEGGAVVTDSEGLLRSMSLFRSHGVTRNAQEGTTKLLNLPFEYDSISIGHNFRMTEFQAALGLSQLARLGSFIEKRNTLAAYYKKLCKDLPIQWQTFSTESGSYSAYHLFIVRLKDEVKPLRRQIVDVLAENGIETSLHYKPLHLLTSLKDQAHSHPLTEANDYGQTALSLPLHTKLSKREIRLTVRLIRDVLQLRPIADSANGNIE